MEPEQVLELIRTAADRYDTVRAALRYRGDGAVRRAIRESIPRSEAGRRAFDVPEHEVSGPIRHPEPEGPFGWRSRVWRADRYHWRLETGVPGGGMHISVCNGRRRLPIGGPPGSGLVWEHRVGAVPQRDDPRWFALAGDHYWTFYALLTDEICGISDELSPLDLTVVGPVAWAGREAWRLSGVPGAAWDWGWDPDPLRWGADDYEVVVDAERGVLLRCASRMRGKDFDALEVEEIHFDEQLGREVFDSRQPLPWR